MQESESKEEDIYFKQKSEIVGSEIIMLENNKTAAEVFGKYFDELQLHNKILNIPENGLLATLNNINDSQAILVSHNIQNGIDAIDVAEKIKNDERLNNIPLILLISVHDKLKIPHEKLKLFNRVVTKPIKKDRLLMALFFVLQITYYEEEGFLVEKGHVKEEKDDENPQTKGLRVLLCEDNEVNMKVAMTILKRFSFHLEFSENGQEALNKFLHVKYDMILMDCMMAVMDGFQATKKIREIEKEREEQHPTLIIALTANAGEDDRQKCLAAGMNDFVPKPIKRETIEVLLRKWFEKDKEFLKTQ